ncbi:hypothetical protein [Leucobacter ruminantium]|nr:hypothetical protein [Leucobacter ruminantium]
MRRFDIAPEPVLSGSVIGPILVIGVVVILVVAAVIWYRKRR